VENFRSKFIQNFIEEQRWKFLTNGLWVTLQVTLFAVLIGIAIGFVIAVIRSTYDKTGKLKILNFFSKVYLTIIRGTPVVVQLLIFFYIIFTSPNASKIFVAVLAFGINSGAYVAEIIRSGIMSIDKGQFEAGRSLGLNYLQTMKSIIIPQAFKNVLPALSNEFIVLLKETSICGYIGLADLTRGGDTIRATTFEPYMPILAVALIYLVIVMILTALISKLERRLSRSDRR